MLSCFGCVVIGGSIDQWRQQQAGDCATVIIAKVKGIEMPNETTRGFRLTVWRPFRPGRPLARESGPSALCEWPINNETPLHEEIYSWQPQIDIWASTMASEQTNKLRQSLEAFNPYASPHERSVGSLTGVLGELARAIQESPNIWADCEQQVEHESGREVQYRTNTILALRNHLLWVYEVFKNVPGASVTIR